DSPSPIGLEEARRRLRDLGYLDGRVERFVFRRALEGRGGLLLPAVLFGAFAAALAAIAAVDTAEPGFGSSPSAVAALVAHVFLGDLIPAAVLAGLAAVWADRSRASAGAATGVGLAAAAAVFLLWIGGVWSLMREIPPAALLWGAPVAIAALLLARSARTGFLARAYAHSHLLPARPRSKVFFGAAVIGVLAAVAIFASRRQPEPVTPPRPSHRAGPVIVIGVDGLALDSEPADRMTGLRALLSKGRTAWWPANAGSPPEIWTDLATGVAASRHGVRALERVRPLGSPLTLRPPLGTAWYLRGLGPRLRVVSTAPVSPRDRKSLAFWEITASAGLPTLAVGWWASGPWPGATVIGNEEILARAADGFAANRDAIAAFRRERTGQSLQTLYLPGLDILREDRERRPAAADEIHRFLEDEVSRAIAGESALVVLAVDSHPSANALGRMVTFDGFAPWSMRRARLEDVAPSILARAGVPVAEDLPGRPLAELFAADRVETATVPTYGLRVAPLTLPSKVTDREYLERLKSLGYLK
ncbi:MAG TPA: hypothetical protein VF376_11150, partial [Thermoanaerobaculia bacterium]